MSDKGSITNKKRSKPNRLLVGFVALTILIILFGLAFLISGREVIERPVLVVFILFAWFGLLAGMAIGSS
ncbi:MAG: hypothetical protein JSV42_10945 [Chloroflexota bacterium]|nr:MAG: hypothetical protein JSV42_10945 [Chloroflexota bacterium]